MILGVTESDGFAIAMIAILGISFSFVLVILVGIVRQARKSHTEEEDLIEEMQREEQVLPSGDSPKEGEPEAWTRKEDWWKGEA